MKHLRRILLGLLGAAALVSKAGADDIDIYRNGVGVGQPYVHILLDVNKDHGVSCTYGSDCAPPFMSSRARQFLGGKYAPGELVNSTGILQAVLSAVLVQSALDNLNVALLISNHQLNAPLAQPQRTGGGTILLGYQQLGSARERVLQTLLSIPAQYDGEPHSLQPRESFYEWYRYITGGPVALGSNTAGNFGQAIPTPGNDLGIINSGRYVSPFVARSACPRLYSIVASLGASSDDEDLDGEIAGSFSLAPGSDFEQLLAFMRHPDTDLLPALDASIPLRETWVIASRENAAQAERYARAGSAGPVLYLDDPVALEAALSQALLKVVSTQGGFTSTSVAIDASAQGGIVDSLYVGLFQPSGAGLWSGNVKKYRLLDSPVVQGRQNITAIVDALGASAFDSDGNDAGRIRFGALSYWTDADTLPPGDGVTVPLGVDGREVARGGAGQKIHGFVTGHIGDSNDALSGTGEAARQVYVEPPGGTELLPLNVDAATLGMLGDLLDPDAELDRDARLELLRWARGQDVDWAKSDARPWILGDVLHSRPLAINYGAIGGHSDDNPLVRLFFGSGDGLFHILEDADPGGAQSGREVFAFYPRQMLPKIGRWRRGEPGAERKHYGVDGSAVAFRVDRNRDGKLNASDGDEAYVYFGLRRGGRGYYALDVSDPGSVPRLAWTITATPGSDFSELGLGFSTPLVGRVMYEQRPRDVLIFAGGYNGGWNDSATGRRGKDLDAADDELGNAIYIVDARTGELVWKAIQGLTGSRSNHHYEHAGLVDSIPSAVSALASAEGIIHRLYVGDSGGALWRVDLPPGESVDHRQDHWLISKLADLGADAAESGGSAQRDLRFFHRPELLHSFDAGGKFDGVLIQSGDRAHPLELQAQNHLFYIKDREVVSGSEVVRAENAAQNPPGRFQFDDLVDQTGCVTGAESADLEGQSINCSELPMPHGWKLRYAEAGEKGLSRPLLDAGRVFATTYVPAADRGCAAREGQGRLYAISLADASALQGASRVSDLGAGIPAEPVHLGGTILLPGRGARLYDLDGDGSADTSKLLPSEAQRAYRTYWRDPSLDIP